MQKLRFVSWNVNGLRACTSKGDFFDFFHTVNADIFAVQETKLQEGQISLELDGYTQYFHSAVKKGYSGTAVFTKIPPLSVSYDFPSQYGDIYLGEGRIITLEFEDFYFVCVYTPNSQRELTRLDFRMGFEDTFFEYLNFLNDKKSVVVCGDLNVAHNDIDLKNPKNNRRNAGFTDEERAKFSRLLENGFTDTFRYLHPDLEGAYTWWSYMFNSRAKNIGWRIDYFLTSSSITHAIIDSSIFPEVMGSDHCPVMLELDAEKLKKH